MARLPRQAAPAPWAWAFAGGLLGLVLAVALFAPAAWLAAAVTGATGGRVVFQDPRGTVWNGSAQLVLTAGPGSSESSALPGRLAWQLRPRWNGAWVGLVADCCMRDPLALRVHLRFGGAGVTVADGQSQWPASLATGLGTPWNTLQFDGDLQLTTRGLSVEWAEGRPVVSGQAELVAQRLSSRLSTLRPMGSYRITLQGGTPTTLQVQTLEGSLQLSGSGQWVGSRLRFQGEASAAPDREAALTNLLNIIGRRNGPRSIITIG